MRCLRASHGLALGAWPGGVGPLGLVDDAGAVAAVVLFVYKLVKARRILADGGIELGRPGRRSPREPDRR